MTGDEIIESFDAVGVHVGDASNPVWIKLTIRTLRKYLSKIRGTHFDDYYSDFDPLSLDGENEVVSHGKYPPISLLIFMPDTHLN